MVPQIPGKAYSAGFTLFIFPIIAFWLLVGSTGGFGTGLLDVAGLVLALIGIICFGISRSSSAASPTLRLAGGLCLVIAIPLAARWLFSTSGLVLLPPVPTELWGGLLVTLVVASVGITGSFPVGIALALGRRSRMPFVRWASVGFIEFVRGVPLITVLFMASVMLPLFLPAGVSFDKLLRALVGVALFAGAYMAETIRGGLQAIPRGQFEAGQALGLSYAQRMGLIILPQALKLVIPGIVNSFVGLFKDTSLVLIIGLFDVLGIVQLNLTDAKWFANSTAMTGYVFAGFVFWIFCFGMSRYSQLIERRLAAGDRR
jgi:general L-amino acid transport system permease protein